MVGNTGGKTFTDDTITQGTPGSTYIIQGQRGQSAGPESKQLGVQFGAGGVPLSVEGGESLKMAA